MTLLAPKNAYLRLKKLLIFVYTLKFFLVTPEFEIVVVGPSELTVSFNTKSNTVCNIAPFSEINENVMDEMVCDYVFELGICCGGTVPDIYDVHSNR
jgi:hypothetical protein